MDNSPAQSNALNTPSAQPQLIAKGISCVVSKRIAKQGMPIGYMVRDNGLSQTDSGWTFLSGEELDYDEKYLDMDVNFQLFDLNTIANYDASIIPLLNSPVGSAFERDNRVTPWRQVNDIPPEGPVVDPYLYRPPGDSPA